MNLKKKSPRMQQREENGQKKERPARTQGNQNEKSNMHLTQAPEGYIRKGEKEVIFKK